MENPVLFHILLQAENLPRVLHSSLSRCHSPSSTTSPTNTLEMPDMAMTTFWDTEVPVMDWISWDRDRDSQSCDPSAPPGSAVPEPRAELQKGPRAAPSPPRPGSSSLVPV